jgi:hypothetical protein
MPARSRLTRRGNFANLQDDESVRIDLSGAEPRIAKEAAWT